ncbi:hypothetical protein NEOLEDRAFT_1240361 [Neolentinus lepideus HHB14362 ss-1]|uniref:Sas10 C-terminal domain-containing protein n=1 Tax=Neolentinus lepideus HHB14362 ss-1 TaxID=1314782 RepID=A0A165TZR6_9AGAM|nr:hypothetical protein NEOLEDRAFT_1240361 [Neolentinus lepideus HHB14362 ss-1]
MVRRRSTKVIKANSKPRGLNRKESKINKWNTVEDIPMDEEDEFHASRDKILLEGQEDADDDYGEEEEVFSLKGIPETDSEDEEEEEGNYEEDKEEQPAKFSSKKSKSKASKKEKHKLTASSSSESEDESEPEESWGTKKSAYYSSNAAQLESEDDEANEMEEREAARLQAKARDALGDDDFGLADAVEVALAEEDVLDLTAPSEPMLPALPTDKKAVIKHLEKTSPETLALARDLEDVVENLKSTKAKIAQLEADTNDDVLLGMAHLHYQALLTYTTTLAFYFHLRSSPKYAAKPETLRSHPVLARLLFLKQSLSTLEDLDFAASIGGSDLDSDDLDDDESDEDIDMMGDANGLWESDKKGPDVLMTPAEFDVFMAQLEAAKTGVRKEATTDGEADAGERPKKKRKTKASAQPAFDLAEPSSSAFSSHPSSTSKSRIDDDIYGDPTALLHADALDKSARKRSLQFYTAKIDSSAARRERARAQWGGDDDVPYRERKRESEKKKLEEARRRGMVGGDDLDETEPEVRKRKEEREDEDENEEGEDGYYSLVKKKKNERKEQKRKEYEAMKAASRPDYDNNTTEGPRALTRAILKNKGLTPHRSKSVRNPRVKKRQKFEQAKKKVASQKAVFKAGAGDVSRYEGEKTGISKVVKSVRL